MATQEERREEGRASTNIDRRVLEDGREVASNVGGVHGKHPNTTGEGGWRVVNQKRRGRTRDLGKCRFGESEFTVEDDSRRRVVRFAVQTGEKRSFILIPHEIGDNFTLLLKSGFGSTSFFSREIWFEGSSYTISIYKRAHWECKLVHYRERKVLARIYIPEKGEAGCSPWQILLSAFETLFPQQQEDPVRQFPPPPPAHAFNIKNQTWRDIASGPRTGNAAPSENWIEERIAKRKKDLSLGIIVKLDWSLSNVAQLECWIRDRWGLEYAPQAFYLGEGDWLIMVRDTKSKELVLQWNHSDEIPSWDTKNWEVAQETGPLSVWLQVWGIPPEMWDPEILKMVAGRFGDVEALEETDGNRNMTYARVLVRPRQWPLLEKWTDLNYGGRCYAILLKPEEFIPPFRVACKLREEEDDESDHKSVDSLALERVESHTEPEVEPLVEPIVQPAAVAQAEPAELQTRLNSVQERADPDVSEHISGSLSLGPWQSSSEQRRPHIPSLLPPINSTTCPNDGLQSRGVIPAAQQISRAIVLAEVQDTNSCNLVGNPNMSKAPLDSPVPLASYSPTADLILAPKNLATPHTSVHDNFLASSPILEHSNPSPIRIQNFTSPVTVYSRKITQASAPRQMLSTENSPNSVQGCCNIQLEDVISSELQKEGNKELGTSMGPKEINLEVIPEKRKSSEFSWVEKLRMEVELGNLIEKDYQAILPKVTKLDASNQIQETERQDRIQTRGRGRGKGVTQATRTKKK